MRTALTVLALVGAVLGAGCRSTQGSDCSGCQPNVQCCRKWQPSCCNNWNWYEPCALIEQESCGECRSYVNQPPCSPCSSR